MKKVFFLSDAHLGSWAIENGRQQELRVVHFLDNIRKEASAVYMLGDIFDFWYEYRYVVPKGFTRLLGKISELTDMGVEVHFFTGNHDLWCGDYLERECGVVLHRDMDFVSIGSKHFCLAHGDGYDHKDRKYLFLRKVFHNRICQRLFSSVHPRWGVSLGYEWARRSRLKHDITEGFWTGTENDGLYQYCQELARTHSPIDYFIFGHRHVDVDILMDGTETRFVILGDWVTKFTYGEFDGERLELKHYEDC